MRKIKIYIFHPYSRIGGADLTISRLINNLNPQKYEMHFICLGYPYIKNYLKKVIKITSLNNKRSITAIPKIRKIIIDNYKNDLKYEKVIFISNQNFANIISIFALLDFKHLKKILVERNNPIELDFIKNYKNKFIKRLIPLTYKYADKIIGISNELSKDLKLICNRPVITIYNPSFDNKTFKLKFKKKNKNKIILCVARFEKQKNHLMLLRAFKLSLEKISSKLLLVGYGSQKKIITKFISDNNLKNNVEIITKPKNVYSFYKKADLFVLTSLYEGFGNVLVEAGMFKVPIISTNCKSGPKEILGNGKFGDLVGINQTERLAYLIVKNLRNPNTTKISRMFKSLKRFNIKTHIKNYEKVFKKL